MSKRTTFLAFLFASLLVAGLFGVVHDQISYTVSSEYYTKFKFLQFGLLDPGVPERVRAAEVGFLASWWMGIPLGLLTGAAGFIHPTAGQMQRALLLSLPVIVGCVLSCALVGLAYGYAQTEHLDLAQYSGWYVPEALERPRQFICVGYMHNAAYIGGVLAIPVAWLFHFWYRRYLTRTSPR